MRQQMIDLGEKPPPLEDAPDDFSDFPPLVSDAFDMYNMLPDRVTTDSEKMILLGKDFTTYEQLCHLYYIDSVEEKRTLYRLLLMIDAVNVKRANRRKN